MLNTQKYKLFASNFLINEFLSILQGIYTNSYKYTADISKFQRGWLTFRGRLILQKKKKPYKFLGYFNNLWMNRAKAWKLLKIFNWPLLLKRKTLLNFNFFISFWKLIGNFSEFQSDQLYKKPFISFVNSFFLTVLTVQYWTVSKNWYNFNENA